MKLLHCIRPKPPSATAGIHVWPFVGYVALGGGYRLQVDGLTHEDDRPFLIMSAHFSFNDYGSRVLAKANEENARVPLASKTFRVPIVDGELDLPIKEIERGDVATTSEAIDLVL